MQGFYSRFFLKENPLKEAVVADLLSSESKDLEGSLTTSSENVEDLPSDDNVPRGEVADVG